MPRIALIHATRVAMAPVEAAFAILWPEADTVSILEEALSADLAAGRVSRAALDGRINALGDYALGLGPQAILYTCSSFGAGIEQAAARLPLPVLKPNEAMFRAAVGQGRNIAMVATFRPAVITMEAEFEEYVAETGVDAKLTTVVAEDAMTALRAGDAETHNRLVAETAPELQGFDTIMLAHFSTSRALDALSARTETPVLTAPGAAVSRLRDLLEG